MLKWIKFSLVKIQFDYACALKYHLTFINEMQKVYERDVVK